VLVSMVRDGKITGKAAKEVFVELAAHGGSPAGIVQAKGLGLVQDEALLNHVIDDTIAAEPELVAKYKSGKTTVLGALVGAVMKKSHGKFLPQKVGELLVKKLAAR